MKRCTKCGLDKPLDDYYRDTRFKCGRRPSCKACCVAVSVSWQKRNADRHMAYQKARRARPDVLAIYAYYARIRGQRAAG